MSGIRATIRNATAADAAAIGRIYVDAWRDAYAGVLPDKLLVGMSADRQAMQWTRQIDRRGKSDIILIAEDSEGTLGFGSGGPGRGSPREAEIYTLYVDPNCQGRGVGRALMNGLFAGLALRGFTSVFLWVVASNPARFFYEAIGGTRIAEKTERLWGIEVMQIAYRWPDLR